VTNQQFRFYAVAALFYLLLTFATLALLIFKTGTHYAGYDYFHFHWNMWWMQRVFTTPGLYIYETNNIFAPMSNNLGYHTLAAVWYPVWAILNPFFGTFAAVNIIIALGCWLNGICTFVFLRDQRIGVGLALLGGAVLQTIPVMRHFYLNTHLNLMNWFLLPVQLLLFKYFVRSLEVNRHGRTAFYVISQGVTLWLMGLTDPQFLIFTAFLLIPYGLWMLWRSPKRLQIVVSGLVVILIGLALLWFVGPLPAMRAFTGTLAPGPVEDRPGIPFPGGFLSMSPTWTVWNTPSLGASLTIFLIISSVVSVSPLRRQMSRERWLWFAAMLLPLLLSMGSDIHIGGLTIPMPFRILHPLTGGNFRMPWRLAPAYVLAALVYCGMVWTPLLRRNAPRPTRRNFAYAALFLLLFVDIRLFESGPLTPLPRPYEFYRVIGQEKEDPQDQSVLLEIPTGVATGETSIGDPRAAELQLYNMLHGKRTLNGFIARAPVENFWWIYTEDAMMAWLGQRRPLEPAIVEQQLRERIAQWPISYVVVHQDIIGRNSATVPEILGFLNAHPDLVCPMWVENDAVVYRTVWHPAGCPPRSPREVASATYQLDLGESGDEKFIGAGWHWQESVPGTLVRWATQQATLYVDLPANRYTLTMNIQAFRKARQITVSINDKPIGNVSIPADNLHTFDFNIPAEFVGSGKHVMITISAESADSPANLGLGDDPRKLSVMIDWLRFTVKNQAKQPIDYHYKSAVRLARPIKDQWINRNR
jgi:hypothetical protein